MNSDRSQWIDDSDKETVRQIIAAAGPCRVGFTEATTVDTADSQIFDSWLRQGHNADMQYMANHDALRRDPRLLLDGALTLISCAFDYRQPVQSPLFADYALGEDYHNVIRRRLKVAAKEISLRWGGSTRICVDTAPVRERYWAAKAGVGTIGLNGQLIVDGIGSKVFLAEILWTVAVRPDRPIENRLCNECRACVRACPGQALDGRCGVDARRCLSYLTIEHRGPLPDNLRLDKRIYGCDICQDVCPLNHKSDNIVISEFTPNPSLMTLTNDDVLNLDEEKFSLIFGHSAVRRAGLSGLKRNASNHDF